MIQRRTDLALERLEGLHESALPGILRRSWRQSPLRVHEITVTDQRGAEALGRPEGRYITAETEPHALSEREWLSRCSFVLGELLRPLLPKTGTVLVVGLGNRAMTPDALGPLTLEHLMITRHLADALPGEFGDLRPVCAVAPGVAGCTGIETLELIRGTAQHVRPAAVIAVDAMAAASSSRLCRTFQLSDTGIVPGSGACNTRRALSEEALGVPVIALGVPTVVEARTLAKDFLPKDSPLSGQASEGSMLVAPKDIDLQVARCAKVLGYAVNLALHGPMELAEMESFLC